MHRQSAVFILLGLALASASFIPSTFQQVHRTKKNLALFEQPTRLSEQRRILLSSLVIAATSTLPVPSTAYDKTYPIELQAVDPGIRRQQQKVNLIKEQQEMEQRAAMRVKPLSAALWASALWFLSGSRSNPVLTPLANIFYDPNEEAWLRDRNDGLFANVPNILYVAMVIVFFAAGAVTDSLAQLAAGPAVSLPLAGVCLVTGAALELGRVASGDKRVTRDEMETAERLEQEFSEFVQARLLPGGNCHRQEIVKAFRRYHAKYRSEEVITDLEIERLIRSWSQTQKGNVKMSSSGFYSGVRINTDADVFVERRR
ncbi:hypothetical protein FisN_11Lh192 [Fistulifera solaris]|uniref:Uncharacterized protein n=1 Tax=Fistulifera solaris TaxID=1519565 RepID=A0A1Z5J7S2_FISSO|nr:hypothetical protein FisN_11Lh192 [Fistulifera solaris]|eukprot:GAX09831.1 hypothetical protein FisN_11Lh192 [Fistulifera solaris]